MSYYKRKRRGYYRKSTRSIMMKFQSFMDISTKADEMQIISISAGGKNLLERLPAQFSAYKYYRIGNIAVKLVPASTLPVDPTGLSLEVGEPGVDPRDQLTPGMMRITNGEDVFEDISGMSAEAQHKLYNAMLLDPRWFKWMLQSGVKRHASPRYWQIGQLHQDKWPGSIVNVPWLTQDGDTIEFSGTAKMQESKIAALPDTAITAFNLNGITGHSSPYGFFQTGHKGVLGWLPTDGMQAVGSVEEPFVASPPEVEVMKIILPPAYKTKYYYRMFITETVYFREPIVQAVGIGDFPYRPLDIFHVAQKGYPMMPGQSYTAEDVSDSESGGNYGND